MDAPRAHLAADRWKAGGLTPVSNPAGQRCVASAPASAQSPAATDPRRSCLRGGAAAPASARRSAVALGFAAPAPVGNSRPAHARGRRMLLQLSANTLVQLLLLATALRRLSSLPKRIGRPLVESMAGDIHYDLLVRAARRALFLAALHGVRAGCSRSRTGSAGDWRWLRRLGGHCVFFF